ncbi:MAG: ATPase involved in chromosome partitioning [Clostridia bacterium]|jgi:Mrp family chromosome partitioning ATPase|nr:ATPase involved in chromosome partitioning [Clostridia bacterium]
MSDCSSCSASSCEGCDKKAAAPAMERPHEQSKIKKVVAIVSGKGGVGKSMVTSLLAVTMQRKGYKVGIMDADITGPSIPKVFGLEEKAYSNELGVLPVESSKGIKIISLNLLMENEESPVIWRGPILGGIVKQFWTDVIWGELDYLFIDMPPGTGDVPLTVYQSIPLDGIVVVTLPQDLVSLIVKKSYNMAKTMNIPILGIVENMSYITCPHCGEIIHLFGSTSIEKLAEELTIKEHARMPIDPEFTQLCDMGKIEEFNKGYLDEFAEKMNGAVNMQ